MHDLLPLLTPMGINDVIGGAFSAILAPIYTAIGAILVFFHWLWSPLFGRDSGLTWVLAIVSLTIVIRTLMVPLFVKTIQSSRNMQQIQPQIQALQKKYGHDRERFAAETQKLYREEGVNPLSSCLPLLLQMPVFFALFRVLDGAANNIGRGWHLRHDHSLVESLRNARFLGADLSGRFFPMNNGFGATQILALALILAMTGLMFYTQLVMTRRNMSAEALTGPFAQQQKMMLYLFPIMYAFGGISIPIGVLIYWFTTNIWNLAQTMIQLRIAPAPNTPAYADWEERMIRKGRDPREIERQARLKRSKAPVAAPMPVEDDGAPARVQRQSVTRQGNKLRAERIQRTTTTTEEPMGQADELEEVVPVRKPTKGGAKAAPRQQTTATQTGGRQQPRRQTRAVRKK